MKIRVGSRGSRLALSQTQMVIEELQKHHPELEAEVVIIKTKGDKILNVSLEKIGDKGLFVKEIEEQLLHGKIDIAIHSMKDMPGDGTEGLVLVPVMKREDPRDVLVTKHVISSLKELPSAPKIGTGSKRRSSQAKMIWDDVVIEPIRGNVETRIKKMLDSELDGTILAYAGINRLKLKSCEAYKIIPFGIDEMIPAPSQGVLALQHRSNDSIIEDLVKDIIDEQTALEAKAERLFLKTLHGSCHLPMGAYLDLKNQQFHGIFGDENCEKVVMKSTDVTKDDVLEKAKEMAQEMLKEVNQ